MQLDLFHKLYFLNKFQTYQQQPFFFSGLFFLSLFVLTSTGMKLNHSSFTFLLACFKSKPKLSFQKQPTHLVCFLHLWLDVLFWDGLSKTPEHLHHPPLYPPHDLSCYLPKWKGIFMAILVHLGSKTLWSKILYYRRTEYLRTYSLVSYVIDQNTTIGSSIEGTSQTSKLLLSCCVPYLNRLYCTSKLMTLPSTMTSFSMKSAPTVAL